MVNKVSYVNFQGNTNQQIEGRPVVVYRTNRKEDLPADVVDISYKNKTEEDKNLLQQTCDTIGKGVKSFVDITVNALAKSASDVVVGKAIDKISGK